MASFADADAELLALVGSDGCRDWVPLIEAWDSVGPALEQLAGWAAADGAGAVVKALSEVRLRPPLPSPTARVFALGTNFASHVASASAAIGGDDSLAKRLAEDPPGGFYVIPGSIIGPDDEFAVPQGAQRIDYEVEAAAVLANGGRNVDPAELRIWGYTGWNDLSVRDPHLGVGLSKLDKGLLSWAMQKNWEGGNACGVYMVVGEDDPADLACISRVNGEIRQNGSTNEMIRSFGDGAAYISQFLSLRPGDVFTSGTPAGTAIEQGADGPFLQPGDTVEIEVGNAGALRNRRTA